MTTATLDELKEAAGAAREVAFSRNRFGYVVDGQRLRRVTTLLNGIPKDALPAWAAREVATFAYEHREAWTGLDKTNAVKMLKGAPWTKRDDAGDRGAAVHNTIEAYVRKGPLPENLTDDEAQCAVNAIEFLKARKSRVLGCEVTVVNFTLGYAGTFDLWDIDADGQSWLLDWKTSKGVYPNHAVQQAAYRNAEFAIVQRKNAGNKDEEKWTGRMISWGPERIDRLGIVHVTPEEAALLPIAEDQVGRLWDVFRAAAFVKTWLLDTDASYGKDPRERVFADPITL